MSLRRNDNRKPAPAPVPASIATDRLAIVLRAGLCVGTRNGTPVESNERKLARASLQANRAGVKLGNNDVEMAIYYLNDAQKIAKEIKAEGSRSRRPRESRRPYTTERIWEYVNIKTKAVLSAYAARDLLKNGEVDEAIECLQDALLAAREMEQLKVEKNQDSSARLVYSSDDEVTKS